VLYMAECLVDLSVAFGLLALQHTGGRHMSASSKCAPT
jgi:hypothetical protein